MWSPLRRWSPIRQWFGALGTFIALCDESLGFAASAESDRRAWTGGSFDVAVCIIRPHRDDAARAVDERAA
jgi:hypothetical protein